MPAARFAVLCTMVLGFVAHGVGCLCIAVGPAADGGAGTDGGTGTDGCPDAAVDDPACAFGPAVALANVNSPMDDDSGPSISLDGLTLCFASSRRPGGGVRSLANIWVARRPSTTADFLAPEFLARADVIGDDTADFEPWISSDGLTLYFTRGELLVEVVDLRMSARTDLGATFGPSEPLDGLNTSATDRGPSASVDGLTLYYNSDRTDGMGRGDIWYSTRADTSLPFTSPANLSGVNSAEWEDYPAISADGLTLLFSSDRPCGKGAADTWVAKRPDTSSPFGEPANAGAPNSEEDDTGPALSADGMTLYFASNRSAATGIGLRHIWVATKPCP